MLRRRKLLLSLAVLAFDTPSAAQGVGAAGRLAAANQARTEAVAGRTGGTVSQGGQGSSAPRPVPTPDNGVAWTVVALIILLGAATAPYPIAFYIRTVWASRQQIIFDTLGWRAKDDYLRLYHRSERGGRGSDSSKPLPPAAPDAAARDAAQARSKPARPGPARSPARRSR